jgi:hypothetical protein
MADDSIRTYTYIMDDLFIRMNVYMWVKGLKVQLLSQLMEDVMGTGIGLLDN